MTMQRGDSQRLSTLPPEMINVCRKDRSMTGPRTNPTTSGTGSYPYLRIT